MNRPAHYWCLFYIVLTVVFATTGFYTPYEGYFKFIDPCYLYVIIVFGSLAIVSLHVYLSSKKSLSLIFKLVSKDHSIIAGGWYRNTNSFLSVFHECNVSMLCVDKNYKQLLMASLQNSDIHFENIPTPPNCSIVIAKGARETYEFIEFKKPDKNIYFLPCDAHFRLNFEGLDDLVKKLNLQASEEGTEWWKVMGG